MKKEAFNHPKMRDLATLLKVPRAIAVGIVEALFLCCQHYAEQGDIGRYTDEQILEQLEIRQPTARWPGIDAKSLIDALVASGFLDAHEQHRLVVHGWSEHAPDFIHMKLFRKCLYFWDGSQPKPSRISKEDRAENLAWYTKNPPQTTFLCAQAVRTTLPSPPVPLLPSPSPDQSLPLCAQTVRTNETGSLKSESATDRELTRVERTLVLDTRLSQSDARSVVDKIRLACIGKPSDAVLEAAVAGAIAAAHKNRRVPGSIVSPAGYAISAMQRVASGGATPDDDLMRQARDALRRTAEMERPPADPARTLETNELLGSIGQLTP